jgi:hypothetical protein
MEEKHIFHENPVEVRSFDGSNLAGFSLSEPDIFNWDQLYR